MTASARHPDPLLRPALACGALIALAVLVAAFGPRAVLPVAAERSPVAEQISLRFADEPGGWVVTTDAATGEVVGRLGIGEGGFVRSTMRNLARERTRRAISDETPFELARLENGNLLLRDPETGRTIGLDAFGRDNAAAFAAFLDHGREPR